MANKWQESLQQNLAMLKDVDELAHLAADPSAGLFEISHALATVNKEMGRHFQCEERSGLFTQMEEASPAHGERIEKTRLQHQVLSDQAASLLANGPSEPNEFATLWREAVRQFCSDFRSHEQQESQLLYEVIQGEAAAQD